MKKHSIANINKNMKYLFIILFVLSGCASKMPTKPPKLGEKQQYYHKQKHPFKDKRIPIVIFWYSTIFIMTYAYVSSIKK